MMVEILNYKCPSCTAKIVFDPKTQKWNCEYCGSSFTLEDLEKHSSTKSENIDVIDKKVKKKMTKEEKEYRGIKEDMDVYHCSSCGAEVIVDQNTSASFCVYCKNTAIIKSKLTGEFAPAFIIPFKNTKDEMIEAFKKIGKGKPLMPKIFNNPKNIEEFTGVYIPFWIFDCSTEGKISGSAKRIITWTTGSNMYTKTDTYSVSRNGNLNFEMIPVDGSSRFADDIMNSIEPFEYKDLTKFSYSYLSGFLSEKYDVNKEEAFEVAKERAKNSIVEGLSNDITGYMSKSIITKEIDVSQSKCDYILLPVWMLNVKFGDKLHIIAMNGQTGKMIGDLPVSKKRAFVMWFIIFIVTFIATTLICWMIR